MSENESTLSHAPDSVPRPERIGPYRVCEVLGEGGMGTVYLAEQTEPIKRRVALKIIKLGMDTRDVIARFESERQALALMNHPHVAAVYDAGVTEQGRPYFVMEYVPGEPITTYCDKHQLSLPERLKLFMQVCHAIQHAHQKGIIHRDIKPSNILVMYQDGRPVPKVIDFGVAKATDQRLTEKTVFTEHGRLIGTPEYMSPEQAEMTTLDIDTRTDVYSLGVLLYELLTGTLPFDPKSLRSAGFAAIQRIIREVEPSKPSTKLGNLLVGDDESGSRAAEKRRLDPRTLIRRLRGDLDWVTMKALEKDRTRRYDSASDFAADIQRHLRNEPVVAGPPSVGYRVSKFVRRNRAGVFVVGVIAATLLMATGISFRYGRSEAKQKRIAQAAKTLAEIKEADAIRAGEAEVAQRELADQRRIEADIEAYASNIALAQIAFDDYNVAEAKRALQRAPQELRGWEWRFMRRSLSQSVGMWRAHAGRVRDIAFSPDGSQLLTCSTMGSARVWDFMTAELIHELDVDSAPVYGVAFRPDGQEMAVVAGDGALRIFDFNGRLLRQLTSGEDFPSDVAYSRDGSLIATGHQSGRLRIIESHTGAALREIQAHEGWCTRVCFSPDDRRVYSGGWEDRVVAAHDPQTGDELWQADAGDVVTSIDAAPHADVLAVCTKSGGFTLDAATGGDRNWHWARIGGHWGAGVDVAFSLEGAVVVFAGRERVSVYDVESRKEITRIALEYSHRPRIAVHPGGWAMALGDDAGRVSVFQRSQQHSFPIRHVQLAVDASVLDSDRLESDAQGRRFVHGLANGKVDLWDIEAGQDSAHGKHTARFEDHEAPVRGVSITSDGELFVSGGLDGLVVIRSWEGTLEPKRVNVGTPVTATALRSDGSLLAIGLSTGRIQIRDSSGGLLRELTGHTRDVLAVAFNTAGGKLASGGHDRSIRIWDVHTGEQLAMATLFDGSVYDVEFDVTDGVLAAGSFDGTVAILQAGDAALVRKIDAHQGEVSSLAFAPDGSRLVTGTFASSDVSLRVWHVQSGRELFVYRATVVRALGFPRDSDRLWLCGADMRLHVLDARSRAEQIANELREEALRRVGRGESLREIYAERVEQRSEPAPHMSWQVVFLALKARLDAEADEAAESAMSDLSSNMNPDRIAESLATDQSVSPAVRRVALRFVRDRLGASRARRLRLQQRLLDRSLSEEEHKHAMEEVESLLGKYQHRPDWVAVRALGLYRVGRLSDCIEVSKAAQTLRLSTKYSGYRLRQQVAVEQPVIETGLLAMALLRNGQDREAAATYAIWEEAMSGTRWIRDELAQAFAPEVREAFAGVTTRGEVE